MLDAYDQESNEYNEAQLWESRVRPLLLWVILALSFLLRIYGNDAGLSAGNLLVSQEEALIVEHSTGILLGYMPTLSWPGSVYMMLIALVFGIVFIVTQIQQLILAMAGSLFDVISVLDNYYIEFFRDPDSFFMLCRYLQATVAAVAAYLTYRLGMEAQEDKAGLMGAAMWAVSPVAVYRGHAVNVDGPMVALMLASLLMAMRYRRDGSYKYLMLATALGGLAMAAKVPGVFTFVPVCGAIFARRNIEKGRATEGVRRPFLLGLSFFTIGLIIGCPYILTAPPAFMKMLLNVSLFNLSVGGVSNGWIYILWKLLPKAMGWAPMLLGVSGLVVMALNKKEGMLMPVALLLAFYLMIGKSQSIYDYYVMPLIPILGLAAGMLLLRLNSRLKSSVRWWSRQKNGWPAIIVMALILAEPVTGVIVKDRDFALDDTRAEALKWIEKNIPPDSVILTTGFANLPLKRNKQSLRRAVEYFESPGFKQDQFKTFLASVGIHHGKSVTGDLTSEGEYPFVALLDSIVAEERFELAKMRFLLADPDPPSPTYDLTFARPGEIKLGKFVQRISAREFDMVLVTPMKSGKDPYKELRIMAKEIASEVIIFESAKGKSAGPIVELYLFAKSGPSPSDPPHLNYLPPSPDH